MNGRRGASKEAVTTTTVALTVELAHVYRRQLERDGFEAWAERFAAEAAVVPWSREPSVYVLVDDYLDEFTPAEREEASAALQEVATEAGHALDGVAFEASCARAAEALLENLPHAGYWFERKSWGHVHSTLLRLADGSWTCPALSAVWTLARLGVEPYYGALAADAVTFGRGRPFAGDEVMTVLSTKYLEIGRAHV